MNQNVLTVIIYSLSLTLLLLVLRRNLYQRLPVFTVFVLTFIARDIIVLFFAYGSIAHTRLWFYTFWTSDFMLSTMYLFVIAEIAKLFLRDYPSIWRSASRLLAIVGIALMSWTIYSAARHFGHPRAFVMVGDQRLTLTISILLLLLMGIGAYYRLKPAPLYLLVLVGIGIYASVQVAGNQIEMQYRLGPDSFWDLIRRGSFAISEIVWIYAVWRWAAPPVCEAELIPQSKYENLSPQIHDRLREAIQKLASLAGERS